MWQQFNERFALGAEVVSHSLIGAVEDLKFDEELGRYIDATPSGQGVILAAGISEPGDRSWWTKLTTSAISTNGSRACANISNPATTR